MPTEDNHDLRDIWPSTMIASLQHQGHLLFTITFSCADIEIGQDRMPSFTFSCSLDSLHAMSHIA